MSYQPEYKEGDRVVIKPWKAMEQEFGLTALGGINSDAGFIAKMEAALSGTDRSVTLGGPRITPGYPGAGEDWVLVADTKLAGYAISPDMILGYAIEYGDKIEVSDDGKKWEPQTFSHYRPGNRLYPIEDRRTIPWKYARPIRELGVEVEVDVRVNGKPVDPSTLSKDTWANLRANEYDLN